MKTPLGTEVDIGAGYIVLDGFPALRERGTAPPLVATVAHLSYCWALVEHFIRSFIAFVNGTFVARVHRIGITVIVTAFCVEDRNSIPCCWIGQMGQNIGFHWSCTESWLFSVPYSSFGPSHILVLDSFHQWCMNSWLNCIVSTTTGTCRRLIITLSWSHPNRNRKWITLPEPTMTSQLVASGDDRQVAAT